MTTQKPYRRLRSWVLIMGASGMLALGTAAVLAGPRSAYVLAAAFGMGALWLMMGIQGLRSSRKR